MKDSRKVLIIAGPNGAGKTTFATEFLPNEARCPIFINADLIAAGMNPSRPDLVAVQAGRLMLKMIHDCVEKKENFAFETTLSGRGFARMIPLWQKEGYLVKLFFLRLPTPEMAIARVRQRVIEGGHNVPEQTIGRRFDSGWNNFNSIYKDLADKWVIHENSGDTRTILGEESVMTIRSQKNRNPGKKSRDQDLIGADAAIVRASERARRRAIETTGSVAVFRDGEIVREKDIRKIFPENNEGN